MKYQYQVAIKGLAQKKYGTFSERHFSNKSRISRVGLRGQLAQNENITVKNIVKVAEELNRDVYVLACSDDTNSEMSTIAASYKVLRDGFESWKIHFMDLIDEFQRTLDPQLILLAPPVELSREQRALLASIVLHLCMNENISPPTWSMKKNFLSKPWFVSEMQSLKAMAIKESPIAFRRNNIFVLNNFLERV